MIAHLRPPDERRRLYGDHPPPLTEQIEVRTSPLEFVGPDMDGESPVRLDNGDTVWISSDSSDIP